MAKGKGTNNSNPKDCKLDSAWRRGKAVAPFYHNNDGTWYTFGATLNPNILNWNTKLSGPKGWDINEQALSNIGQYTHKNVYTPGIMVLQFLPTIGKCQEFNDAMNVAGRGLHTYIWHKATRSTHYDAADLMIYCGVADSLNAFYGLMCRLYGMIPLYGYNNAYYPEAALYAQGFDPDDFRNHQPQLRSYINMFARKIGRFAVPASLPIFKRHNYLCSNVFKDDDDPDIYQTYIPMPAGFYKFGLDTNGWGMMEFKPMNFATMGATPWSVASLMAYGDDLINSLAYMPDMDEISADVLQAMGPENCWGVSTIGEDYRTEPVYDESFLMQTDNMDFLGNLVPTMSYDVIQTQKGVVIQHTVLGNAEIYQLYENAPVTPIPLYGSKRIIWNKPTTTLEEVMELTRGVSFPISAGLDTTNKIAFLEPKYCGTEVWLTMKIVNDLNLAASSFWHTYAGTGFINFDISGSGSGASQGRVDVMDWFASVNSFKHHPAVRMCLTASSGTITVGLDNRDMRHYATVTDQQMEEINTQAVFSEWNVARSNFVIE